MTFLRVTAIFASAADIYVGARDLVPTLTSGSFGQNRRDAMGQRVRRLRAMRLALRALCAGFAALVPSLSTTAQTTIGGVVRCCNNPTPHAHGQLTSAMRPKALTSSGGELLTDAPASAPGDFKIVINATASLQAQPQALAAFQRAARQWETRIQDPVTVTIDADFRTLFDDNILGETDATILQGSFDLVSEVMILDAMNEGGNSPVITSLPSAVGFSAQVPTGRTFSTPVRILGTKANFKAHGYQGLDTAFPFADGTVTFNDSFAFDFDNRDGVGSDSIDFETVAAHEIGHVLGFISRVDSINGGDPLADPFLLDLFRFPDGTSDDPSDAFGFRLNSRNLRPGGQHILDDLDNEYGFSTGLTGFGQLGGDGFQASHWKSDDLTGVLIGLMDPTLAFGQFFPVAESDLRALDLIGYDVIPIPEPGAAALLALTAPFLARRRRTTRPRSS